MAGARAETVKGTGRLGRRLAALDRDSYGFTLENCGAGPGTVGDSTANRKLPPLAVKDIEGTQWTLDRFTGENDHCRRLGNVVRTMPRVFAKLVERLKGRGDVLAVSFNTDENIALVEPFARSSGYTFPQLSAKQYAEDLMPLVTIPRTWIIRNGTIVEEHVGFGAMATVGRRNAFGPEVEDLLNTPGSRNCGSCPDGRRSGKLL
jgi:hypothetical protein